MALYSTSNLVVSSSVYLKRGPKICLLFMKSRARDNTAALSHTYTASRGKWESDFPLQSILSQFTAYPRISDCQLLSGPLPFWNISRRAKKTSRVTRVLTNLLRLSSFGSYKEVVCTVFSVMRLIVWIILSELDNLTSRAVIRSENTAR
jgi:hypothetical protein